MNDFIKNIDNSKKEIINELTLGCEKLFFWRCSRRPCWNLKFVKLIILVRNGLNKSRKPIEIA